MDLGVIVVVIGEIMLWICGNGFFVLNFNKYDCFLGVIVFLFKVVSDLFLLNIIWIVLNGSIDCVELVLFGWFFLNFFKLC